MSEGLKYINDTLVKNPQKKIVEKAKQSFDYVGKKIHNPTNNDEDRGSGSEGIFSTLMRIMRNPIVELVGSIFLILFVCYYLQGVSNTSQTINVTETYFLNLCLKIWGWLLIIVILCCFVWKK